MRLRPSLNESPSSLLSAFADANVAIGDGRSPYTNTVPLANDWVIDADDVSNDVMEYKDRAILCTTNANVDTINSVAFNSFPGESRRYYSTDKIIDGDDPESDSATYPVEFLRTLNPSGMPAHIIPLKVGMPLVILRNLDPDNGLCNGNTVLYVDFHP